MKVKFQNTMFLSGFSSTASIGTERGYIEDCTYFVPPKDHQKLINVLDLQPSFHKVHFNFQLFKDDTKHQAFRKFDACPHFIQHAADISMASFCDDLMRSGMIELADRITNEWLSKGVDSIHYVTNNTIYIGEYTDFTHAPKAAAVNA